MAPLPIPHVTVAYLPTTAIGLTRADTGPPPRRRARFEYRRPRDSSQERQVKHVRCFTRSRSVRGQQPAAPHPLARRVNDQQAVPLPDFFSGKLGSSVTGGPATRDLSLSPARAGIPC
jgi:hypothetical protein